MINYFATYLWYVSIDLIPVAINTALSRSAVIWVFIGSVIFLKEEVKPLKVISVIFSVAGVALVAWGNIITSGLGNNNEIKGYILILSATFLSSVFEIILRIAIGKANSWGILLNQSLQGFFVLVLLWPLVPIFFYAKLEPIVYFTPQVTSYLFVNAAFAVSYYLLYAFGNKIPSFSFLSHPFQQESHTLLHYTFPLPVSSKSLYQRLWITLSTGKLTIG